MGIEYVYICSYFVCRSSVKMFAVVLWSLLFNSVSSSLLNFGEGSGDINILDTDISNSSEIYTVNGLRIGNSVYRSIFVSPYGLVSFGEPLGPCCKQWTPRTANQPIPFVAPLWSYGERQSISQVYYRERLTSDEFSEVQKEVKRSYNLKHFEPNFVFVVTWVDIPCCSSENQINNTFQLVLISDIFRSYAVFRYAENGSLLYSSELQIFNEVSWWSGFNLGDGRYYALPHGENNYFSGAVALTDNPVEARSDGRDFLIALPRISSIPDEIAFILSTSSTEEITVFVEAPAVGYRRSATVSQNRGNILTLGKEDAEQLILTSEFQNNKAVRVYVSERSIEQTISVFVNSNLKHQSAMFLAMPSDSLNLLQFEDEFMTYYAIMYADGNEEVDVDIRDKSFIIIVAHHDLTVLNISTIQPAYIGSNIPTTTDQYKIVTLDRSETLFIQSEFDLTGSKVTVWGGKPISLFSGHGGTQVPADRQHKDFIGEMIPPVNMWGKTYVTAPLLTRTKYDLYRVLSAFDDTTVKIKCWTKLNDQAFNMTTINFTLAGGKFWESGTQLGGQDTVSSHQYCLVCSDKPILVVQFSTGAFVDFSPAANPSMIVLPPTDSYGHQSTFFRPSRAYNPFKNYVNIIIPVADYQPDSIMIGSFSLKTLLNSDTPDLYSIPPGWPQYYIARLQFPTATTSYSITHRNPLARLGIVLYGFAAFTSFGATGAFNKQSDILVVGSNNKVLPQDGYILMEATTSLTCYTNPDCYEADSVEWLDQNGNRITISKREDVYQELSDFKSVIYFTSKNLSLEGFYLCRGRIAEGVVKQIKVGVFDTPPVPGEVSSLSVTAMSPSTVHTKWQPPLEPFGLKVLGYTVIVFPNNTIEYDTFKVANTVTEITIDNLKANSAYSIGVYVSSTTGSGPASFTPSILTHRNTDELQRCLSLTLSTDLFSIELEELETRYLPVPFGTRFTIKCACSIQASSSRPLWYHGTTEVTTDRNQDQFQENIVKESTLRIESFSKEYTGLYICQDFFSETYVYLLPINARNIELPSVLQPPMGYQAELKSNILLHCPVRGDGLTSIHWEARSGSSLPSTKPGHPLVLYNVGLEREDDYRCRVINSEGDEAVSPYAVVSIYGTPTLTTTGVHKVVVNVTQSVEFTCQVAVETRAVHTPQLLWFKDDKQYNVTNVAIRGRKVQSVHDVETTAGSDKDIHNYKLIFDEALIRDIGIYECRLFHRVGSTHNHATFNISVQFKPQNMTVSPNGRYQISRYSVYNVMLRCIVNGNPLPLMVWSHNGTSVRQQVTKQLEHMIIPRNVSASGRYVCAASNILGTATQSSLEVHITDPQISVGDENFHNNSYVTIGNNYPQEIVCSLNGIGVNEATVSWYYPNGLEVSTKEGLSGPYQVHRSGGRTIEAVMTWSPLPDATERASSFSGEGFYRCHIRTIVEVELDYYLGVYITEPVPSPPIAITLRHEIGASLNVTWGPPINFPVGFIRVYTIRHYKIEDDEYVPVEKRLVEKNAHSYVFHRVQEGVQHVFGVIAESNGGSSPMILSYPTLVPVDVTYQDKCEEISVRLQIPRRRDPNVIDATLKIKLRKQVIIFCSCIRPTSTLVTTDPIWLKGEEALTQTNSGRIRFYYLPRTKVAVLHITNFQLSDIGTYTCEDYQLRESLQIVPPSDDSSSGISAGKFVIPKEVIAVPGSTLYLPCIIEGQSSLNASWIKGDSTPIPPASPPSMLFFGSMQQEDFGSYTCLVQLPSGTRKSLPITIKTYDPPTVSGNTTKQVQAGIRRRLGLTCSIQNHPIALEEVEFQWYRNGTKFNIPGGRIRKLGRPEDSTRLTTSTVDFNPVTYPDEGMYSCLATNLRGSVWQNFSLTVHPGPSSISLNPVEGPLRTIIGLNFTIGCFGSGSPPPSITWKKLGSPTVLATGEGSAILLVTNVRKRDDGVYRCSVENIFGSLDKSIRVLVQDHCEDKGFDCDHTCLPFDENYQCACEDGYSSSDRIGGCVTCGLLPYRPRNLPTIQGVPREIFMQNYDTAPWTISFCSQTDSKLFCGGVLINHEWVLTLGSCVCGKDFRDLSAVFVDPFTTNQNPGSTGAQSNCWSYPAFSSQVLEIVCHQNYSSSSEGEDVVALVRIAKVNLASEGTPFRAACLPSDRDVSKPPSTAHWTMFLPSIEGGRVLRRETNILTRGSQCNALSTASRSVCIAPTRTPCARVGGTALVSYNSAEQYWFVTGLLNGHFSECTRRVQFEQHISVYYFLDWIREETGVRNFES